MLTAAREIRNNHNNKQEHTPEQPPSLTSVANSALPSTLLGSSSSNKKHYQRQHKQQKQQKNSNRHNVWLDVYEYAQSRLTPGHPSRRNYTSTSASVLLDSYSYSLPPDSPATNLPREPAPRAVREDPSVENVVARKHSRDIRRATTAAPIVVSSFSRSSSRRRPQSAAASTSKVVSTSRNSAPLFSKDSNNRHRNISNNQSKLSTSSGAQTSRVGGNCTITKPCRRLRPKSAHRSSLHTKRERKSNEKENENGKDCVLSVVELSFANGNHYQGEWCGSKPAGFGTYKWKDGSEYCGQFMLGEFHGRGSKCWPTGKKYAGDWEHSLYHGHGELVFPDESTYVGEFFEVRFETKCADSLFFISLEHLLYKSLLTFFFSFFIYFPPPPTSSHFHSGFVPWQRKTAVE